MPTYKPEAVVDRIVVDRHVEEHAAGGVLVGDGEFRYRVATDWPHLPADMNLVEAAGVATDSRNRALVFNRGEHPVAVFDSDGNLLDRWGKGLFVRAHGITIGPDDSVFFVDDTDHTVKKYSPDGRLLMTLGVSGHKSDTGATSIDYRTIRRSGSPFNYPTNLAIAPTGDLFVSDGYGNARIHKFSPDGSLLLSWGEPGKGPGQFHVPHGIAVDEECRVYVADRENDRIQIFSRAGEYLTEWRDLARPCEVFIDGAGMVYVAELGYRAGMWPGVSPPSADATGGRVSILDANGSLLARWGGGDHPCDPGDFLAPHDIWVDSRRDVYVSEVVASAGGNCGVDVSTCHYVQKFVRCVGP